MTTRGDGPSPTIPALLATAASRFGQRPAVEDGPTRLSYAELLEPRPGSFGAALVASGVEPGDRVAIWAFNSAEWIVAALGLFQAGAVLVPVNTRFKGGEAADILSRSRARVLVTVTDFLDTDYVALLRAGDVELPHLEHDRGRAAGGRPRGPSPGPRSSAGRPIRGGPRSTGGAGAWDPTTLRTSSSPRGRPGCRRVW